MTTKMIATFHFRTGLFVLLLFTFISQHHATRVLSSEDIFQYLKMMDTMVSYYKRRDTIFGFGRNVLCDGSVTGLKHFVHGLRQKMCKVSDDFLWRLAEKMCQLKGEILNDWVSEIFDLNGDGIISSFEKDVPEIETY